MHSLEQAFEATVTFVYKRRAMTIMLSVPYSMYACKPLIRELTMRQIGERKEALLTEFMQPALTRGETNFSWAYRAFMSHSPA